MTQRLSARAEWERRGVRFEQALEMGRAKMSHDFGPGPSLSGEQIEAVVTAIQRHELTRA